MRTRPNHKSQFPEINLLDDENRRKKYESDLSELSRAEQKKFSYVPPTKVNNFSGRKLFWSVKLEIAGRLLIFLAAIMTIVISFILGKYGLLATIEETFGINIVFFGIDVSHVAAYGLMYVSLIFSLFYILPMILTRTVGGVKRWAMVYIGFAIAYFIFFELICAGLIIFNSISLFEGGAEVSKIYPLLIVLVLTTTIIQIIGSCFLVVKSDDIRQRLSLEV
ncbi:hypothetical protein [Spiroplasma endosymbiont of Othius punctulatus]|uniref:hypothetical protein n=1 Tax=Spiroplasma endosymbiont of Othius punctulatus TaxID=3066289 RepID=UPI0030D328D5